MEKLSTIEKMLGGEFTSDPRLSRFPLPEIPAGSPEGVPYVHSGFVITPEMARDYLLNRVIRRDRMPRDLLTDDILPNRKILIAYAKMGARKLREDPAWWNRGTPQTASFTREGFLLDAQHRMAWCALSGNPILLPVALGTPWSAYHDIDQNRRRAAHQMLDIPYASQAAAVARHLIPTLRGTSAREWVVSGAATNEMVIEICLGWPYFTEDSPWMSEINAAASEAKIPGAPLGAAVVGALAGGANADDVQQFLNGLRPLTYNVPFITIGTDGDDPRRLLARYFGKMRSRRDAGKRYTEAQERSNAAAIRYMLHVWLMRHEDRPIKVKQVISWPPNRDLPPLWNEPAITRFHSDHAN